MTTSTAAPSGNSLTVAPQLNNLDALLGHGQRRRTDFPSDPIMCHFKPRNATARQRLIDWIAPSPNEFAWLMVHGGGDLPRILLDFVANLRSQGDCVIYLHNYDDLLKNPRVVLSGAILNATAAWCDRPFNVATLLPWCRRIEAWSNEPSGALEQELALFATNVSHLLPWVGSTGKKLIFVMNPHVHRIPGTIMNIMRTVTTNLTVVCAPVDDAIDKIILFPLFDIAVNITEFMGPRQHLQPDRFLDSQFVIYDNEERMTARWALRRALNRSIRAVSYWGLGGCGKSHNLLRFVYEQRLAGDCVVYIHNCEDLRISPRDVIAGAIINALRAFHRSTTDAEFQRLIHMVTVWQESLLTPWAKEGSTLHLKLIAPLRAFVQAKGGRFIVVFDQEDRLYGRSVDVTVDWSQSFIKSVDADFVVVSGSGKDDDEGYQQRRWTTTILQRPNSMPEPFALKLLQAASSCIYPGAFESQSEEVDYLKMTIGQKGGGGGGWAFGPLEVNKVRAMIEEQQIEGSPIPTAVDVCRAALSSYAWEVSSMHREFYDKLSSRSDPTYLVTAMSWFDGLNEPQEPYDRRFCAMDHGNMMFSSKMVRDVMFRVLRQQCVAYPYTGLLFAKLPNYYLVGTCGTKILSSTFILRNSQAVRFLRGVPFFGTFDSVAQTFDKAKAAGCFDSKVVETNEKRVLLRPEHQPDYPEYDGVMINSWYDRDDKEVNADVVFIRCIMNPTQKDTYNDMTQFGSDFDRWMSLCGPLSQVRIRWLYLWVSPTVPYKVADVSPEKLPSTKQDAPLEQRWALTLDGEEVIFDPIQHHDLIHGANNSLEVLMSKRKPTYCLLEQYHLCMPIDQLIKATTRASSAIAEPSRPLTLPWAGRTQ